MILFFKSFIVGFGLYTLFFSPFLNKAVGRMCVCVCVCVGKKVHRRMFQNLAEQNLSSIHLIWRVMK